VLLPLPLLLLLMLLKCTILLWSHTRHNHHPRPALPTHQATHIIWKESKRGAAKSEGNNTEERQKNKPTANFSGRWFGSSCPRATQQNRWTRTTTTMTGWGPDLMEANSTKIKRKKKETECTQQGNGIAKEEKEKKIMILRGDDWADYNKYITLAWW
jgi:hypothetical protein